MTDPLKEEDLFESGDDGLPLPKEILALLRQVINLIINDSDNGDDDGDEITEVRQFRNA